eukprot:1949807-Amphidinium_carterae.2
MSQQLTQQMQSDYAASTKQKLNLAAVAGSLNWVALRSRPGISWAFLRATHQCKSVSLSERERPVIKEGP